MSTLHHSIIAELSTPSEWQVVQTYPKSVYSLEVYSIRHESGTELEIKEDRNEKGKLVISHHRPERPHGKSGGHWVEVYDSQFKKISVPAIRCAMTKSPATIARDIEKRILPMAHEVTRLVLSTLEKERRNDEDKLETLHAVYKAANREVRYDMTCHSKHFPNGDSEHEYLPNMDKPQSTFSVMPSPCKGYISEVEVRSGNCVQINFSSMSKEQAVKLLEYVTSSKLLEKF